MLEGYMEVTGTSLFPRGSQSRRRDHHMCKWPQTSRDTDFLGESGTAGERFWQAPQTRHHLSRDWRRQWLFDKPRCSRKTFCPSVITMFLVSRCDVLAFGAWEGTSPPRARQFLQTVSNANRSSSFICQSAHSEPTPNGLLNRAPTLPLP